ncbi:MAG: glycosyltransferase [Flavobacteriaceae bacterium]|nr:glycosyltransferase [Flavobacteriaceae bacterium]
MKALIITYYWPPAGGSGVQRWLKFVKYLRDFGIEPIVFTVDNPSYAICDESLKNEIPKGVEVLRQPIWEPNDLFSFLGSKNKGVSAGFLNPNPSVAGKIMQYIRANYFIPDARKFWIQPSVKRLKTYVQEHHVDLLISTGPPHSVHLIAKALKEASKLPWIADFRDPWTDIDYFHQLPLTVASKKRHFQLEKAVVQTADAVLVVGKTMQETYQKLNKNTHVIYNGFDTTPEFTAEAVLDLKFSLTHIGLMNNDRNHAILWEAISELCQESKEFENDFTLNLIGKIAPEVRTSIKAHGLEAQVTITNYVPHEQVLEFQKKSQVLLLSVNNVPSAKGILTGKIFEYLNAHRPIIALAPREGDLAAILRDCKAGVCVGFTEKERLKKTLLDFYKDYKKKVLVSTAQDIEQFHRKNLTKSLSKIICTLVQATTK